jgi:4-alpha-glucanotransferase
MATDRWGIDDGWEDTTERWRPAAPGVRERLVEAMGGEPSAPAPPPGRDVVVARTGRHAPLSQPCRLELEDGTDAGVVEALPPDLPLGLHRLVAVAVGEEASVLAGPGRCHLPEGLRTWGLAAQVPTTRSRGSWGIGDLADVRALARWVSEQGGGALELSPLHAPTPVGSLPASPYSPSSRRWHSPLLLRVDEVPGAAEDPVVAAEAEAARRLLGERVVDRDRSWAHQRAALEHLWAALGDRERTRLDGWRREHGDALESWARYCTIADEHGARWSDWPADLRHPSSPAVERMATARPDRVAFHAWLQRLVADQLAGAAAPDVRLVQDLAIGVDPDGADAWVLQDLLALDVSIGAPPDDFSPDGQVWGLPPFVPWRLRDAGYRPLAELLRAAMTPHGGLRVDHVMGLSRLFWVPNGATPDDGTYVRFHGRELLEVLALESQRAGAIVVGEDLGTVEDELREDLAAARVLTTRVVWFEDDPPEKYPVASLGVVTTHDLPTVAGMWTGADEDELVALDRPTPPEAGAGVRARLDALVDLAPDADPADVVVQVHDRLSAGASVLVLGTVEDLCAVPERPNVPGTTDERPNWSLALPVPVEDLPQHPAAAAALAALSCHRPATGRAD